MVVVVENRNLQFKFAVGELSGPKKSRGYPRCLSSLVAPTPVGKQSNYMGHRRAQGTRAVLGVLLLRLLSGSIRIIWATEEPRVPVLFLVSCCSDPWRAAFELYGPQNSPGYPCCS